MYSLRNRSALITGGSRGLGALVARKYAAEGCNVAINYASSKDDADNLAAEIREKYKVNAITIQGDAGRQSDCVNAVKTTIQQLGGLDIVVSNAGWTKITKFGDLDAMDNEDWDKCWSVNVKGHLYLFKAALPTFNANPEGGVFLLTSSIAAVTPTGSSLPYAVTKAGGLHLVKCLAQTQGSKIRVNAVLPGLLLTEWGQRFSPEAIEKWTASTSLKKAPDLEDTANVYVMLAQNTSMTGQSIQIDSGFSFR
ncbi:NADP(+)-dependent dehydrogenase [Aspergillus sclerotioniger CBS 115572]|uniref:NADP(+)-dependent dehydrogenase n=1 Tax=Aspergillus sclerotioniger CBS 115572 TaxID=1450535 RepID=A0A317VS58_9EURO|nr:NADP(+)-dependent dehydrogenase [Aspergillus sclerotioniger CBS 115572]PWY76409.1 NADP(+)-dependent dehydrogenase [Aspergillus sclerotioniger CBS 115572]